MGIGWQSQKRVDKKIKKRKARREEQPKGRAKKSGTKKAK